MKLYTVKEVQALLGVGQRTMYNYLESGKLKAIKIGRKWRISQDALDSLLTTGTEILDKNRRKANQTGAPLTYAPTVNVYPFTGAQLQEVLSLPRGSACEQYGLTRADVDLLQSSFCRYKKIEYTEEGHVKYNDWKGPCELEGLARYFDPKGLYLFQAMRPE